MVETKKRPRSKPNTAISMCRKQERLPKSPAKDCLRTRRNLLKDNHIAVKVPESLIKPPRQISPTPIDNHDIGTSTSARRSKRRTFAVDPNKPMHIIRPKDDLRSRFNLGPKELSELEAILNEDPHEDPFAVRFDDSSGFPSPINNSEVYTPRVVSAGQHSDSRTSPKAKCSAKSGLKRKHFQERRLENTSDETDPKLSIPPPNFNVVRQGSKYIDYDIDSDDETFLKSLSLNKCEICKADECSHRKRTKHSISSTKDRFSDKDGTSYPLLTSTFEEMISILERELEIAKMFLKERIKAELQGLVTKNLIEDGLSSLKFVNQYFKYSSNNDIPSGLEALNKAYEHSQREESCLSRRASTSSIVNAAVAAATAAANSDESSNSKCDFLSKLSCPAPLAVLLSTIPRNTPKDVAHSSAEANAVFESTIKRSTSANTLSSKQASSPACFSSGGNQATTMSQYFSCAHLKELVPEERMLVVLARVFSHSQTSDQNSPPTSTQDFSDPTKCIDSQVQEVLREVYEYWINKRSRHLDSLLRCYHNFMMDEWHQAPSMPPLPEDFNLEQLKSGHKQLYRLRSDLDRARLIVDRVRRRERIKKELIKTSSSHFDKIFRSIEASNLGSKRPASRPKKKKKNEKTNTKGAAENDTSLVLSELSSSLRKRPFSLIYGNVGDIPQAVLPESDSNSLQSEDPRGDAQSAVQAATSIQEKAADQSKQPGSTAQQGASGRVKEGIKEAKQEGSVDSCESVRSSETMRVPNGSVRARRPASGPHTPSIVSIPKLKKDLAGVRGRRSLETSDSPVSKKSTRKPLTRSSTLGKRTAGRLNSPASTSEDEDESEMSVDSASLSSSSYNDDDDDDDDCSQESNSSSHGASSRRLSKTKKYTNTARRDKSVWKHNLRSRNRPAYDKSEKESSSDEKNLTACSSDSCADGDSGADSDVCDDEVSRNTRGRSSNVGDPPGGYGSRSVKRGSYSPALCSLSGLAKPFMSAGGFASFKACFS